MKKKILIIILSFFFIALLIGGGILLRNISIQRQEHIDELMQIELPDNTDKCGKELADWITDAVLN